MEKVIYALWADEVDDQETFFQSLIKKTGPRLAKIAHGVRVNIPDADVAGGNSPRAVSTKPQMNAFIQIWMNSANDMLRAPYDDIIAGSCVRFEAWLVSESVPLPNTQFPAKAKQRTHGFSQMVCLKRPDRLSWEEWRDIWQNSHTKVAVDTQSNFEYRQNLVTRRLTGDSGSYDAIIEECFPQAALTDPLTYFDAPGDPDKMQANLKMMMDSVARFIDHSRMDCVPTSQYEIKPLR